MSSKFTQFICLLLVSFLTSCGGDENSSSQSNFNASKKIQTCSPESARLLGRAFRLANPMNDPRELEVFLRQNRSAFRENGSAVRCAKALGNAMVRQGVNAFSEMSYNDAYGGALQMGANGDQARKIANSMTSGAVDVYMMGEELIWLAKVLPAAEQGNWQPFNTTGTIQRQQARQYLPFYRQMRQMDPAISAVFEQTMKQFGPLIEEQVVVYANMLLK